ncbi:fumarate hydratase [Serratia symbiotica]|nr:fumarate hydratase [Serratia symbiotica]
MYNTYIEDNLRYSQNTALDMYKEVNTGSNLPAQIDFYTVDGEEYKFLCIAKDSGLANKTYLYQETKALLSPGKLKDYLVDKMRTLGTAACPPYHVELVCYQRHFGQSNAEDRQTILYQVLRLLAD